MKRCTVYTRTGDKGTTSLVGGTRVEKSCCRLEAYGTIDELNSQLGLLLTYIEEVGERDRILQCQNDLFVIGGILATETTCEGEKTCMRIGEEDITALEHAIDAAHEGLPPWRGFTLPGGCRAAAMAHVCRTVCRRAERCICRLTEETPVDENLCCYINRLSDYLYVLACKLNFQASVEENLWKKPDHS